MLRPASAHLSFQGPELHFSECACVCCSMGFMSEIDIHTNTTHNFVHQISFC